MGTGTHLKTLKALEDTELAQSSRPALPNNRALRNSSCVASCSHPRLGQRDLAQPHSPATDRDVGGRLMVPDNVLGHTLVPSTYGCGTPKDKGEIRLQGDGAVVSCF
jgi:hypothetical protein